MTTEIAVLSRNGIALATDSAITVSGLGSTKIFDTADKLFELHCFHPVAIMLNGSMDFFGAPWELIIKDFRKAEESKPNRSLEQWASDFLAFVAARDDIKSASAKYVRTVALRELAILKGEVFDRCWNDPRIFSQDPSVKVPPIISQYIEDRTKWLSSIPVCENLKELKASEILSDHRSDLKEIIEFDLQPIKVSDEIIETISVLIVGVCLATISSPHSTGLIIAGYGADQDYPGVLSIEIDGCLKGKLKSFLPDGRTEIKDPEFGYAFPFAQNDVIERLLNGADPRFVEQTSNFLLFAAEQLAMPVAESILAPSSSKAKRTAAAEKVKSFIREIARSYVEETVPSFSAQFREDFERMIAMMPKPELIELAEALVSITAIERKASSDERSVGGPIDVAFITKHEGFVWIKRKYYFEERLNPRYFWRRYRSVKSGGSE